ncbi:MAG: hypothetical protein ACKPEQ_36695 [Dolichospermum sp.]
MPARYVPPHTSKCCIVQQRIWNMNKDQIRQLDDQAIQQFDKEYVDDY